MAKYGFNKNITKITWLGNCQANAKILLKDAPDHINSRLTKIPLKIRIVFKAIFS
jgi:hypothetical protein